MLKKLFGLSVILWLIKIFIGYFLELGNDEVYYYTYAKELEISYFDHPIMVGLCAWFSTFGLTFKSELFLRFFPLLFGFLNPFVLFYIVKYLKDERTAIYAAILYLSTIYASVISGIFILPDAPLSFFILLCLYFGLKVIKEEKTSYLFPFSFFLALALLSKYQAVFIGLGMAIYIFKYHSNWLKKKELWLAFLIAISGIIPTIVWNIQHDFINFQFHSNRVGAAILFEYFPREIFGQIFYQNPIVFGIIIVSLFQLKHYKKDEKLIQFLLFSSLPLIFTSIFLSIFTESLPHWSGISYIPLIIITAIIFVEKKWNRKWLYASYFFLIFILIFGYVEIQNGYISNLSTQKQNIEKKGKHDATQDTYGWKQLSEKFHEFYNKQENKPTLIISNRWYPASHLEYYVAEPNGIELIAEGELSDIHQYTFRKNEEILQKNDNRAYFIAQSNSSFRPESQYSEEFKITPLDTIPITRRNDTIRYHFVYLMEKK